MHYAAATATRCAVRPNPGLGPCRDIEQLVSRNVAALVRVPIPRTGHRAVWSVEDARQSLESSRSAGDPLHAGYVLMLILGLRRGELLGLGWSEVNLEAEEMRARWQLQLTWVGAKGTRTPKPLLAKWRGKHRRGASKPAQTRDPSPRVTTLQACCCSLLLQVPRLLPCRPVSEVPTT